MKPLLLAFLFAGAIPKLCGAQLSDPAGHQVLTAEPHDYYSKITFVYGAERVENDPFLVESLLILLRDRITYRFEVETTEEKYPEITSFPLMNKYNPAIMSHEPAGFDVTTFNPLIYGWSFFSDRTQVFRIDGTPYIMIVQPQ